MTRSYVEHVAIRVRDIAWHLRFFQDVLGMTVRDEQVGPPHQIWTVGGIQLVSTPDFSGPEGRLAHLGVMAEDADAVTAKSKALPGVTTMPQGDNWLLLPDGLVVEILQATGTSVAEALAINPRG